MAKQHIDDGYRRAAVALATEARQIRNNAAMFSSAWRGEGTSSSIIHIGRFLRKDLGMNPVVIELNGARPTFQKLFSLNEKQSLAALAREERPPLDCVQQDSSGLSLIPAGSLDSASWGAAGLESVLCRAVQSLQNSFNLILIDAPPILESAETLLAGRVVPNLVLVVGAGVVSQESLARTRQELRDANINIIGTILNTRKRLIPGWIDRWLSQ